MRYAVAFIAAILTLSSPVAAVPEFLSRQAVAEWIDGYRLKPQPSRLPDAVRALSNGGALRDPENAAFYVGFVSAVLGANSKTAEAMAGKMLPLPPADQWVVVRALAYSGLPEWKPIMRRIAPRLPARQAMIDQYLAGALPPLDAIAFDKPPSFLEKVQLHMGAKVPGPEISFGKNPELLDILWGQYFATGDYAPVWRIIAMLPWTKDRDSVDRLTIGSMAKVTLANNATMYPDLLFMLKDKAKYQPEEIAPLLNEVIQAAETAQASRLKKQALAEIEELKRKGPGYRRDMTLWGTVGQGVIALGCIAAAAVSLTAAGIPCVVGGAVTSAALSYWAVQ